MIIIGYPGIGKTTLAASYWYDSEKGGPKGIIDLESNNFHAMRGDFISDIYCRAAENLSRQGYVVFVSSHEGVQTMLRASKELVYVCHPAKHLRPKWTEKLRQRYLDSCYFESNNIDLKTIEESKNLAAYHHVCDHYDEDIEALDNNGFKQIIIDDMDYDLGALVWKAYYGKE